MRSACVAMGALQEFSNAKPVTVTHDASALGDGHRTEAATPAQTVGETPSSSGRADDEQTGTPKLIDSVDYIISVSGGGYTAGARLLACQDRPPASTDQAPASLEACGSGATRCDLKNPAARQ